MSIGGPYCSEGMDKWYVAVEDASYLEAWREVKGTASQFMESDQRFKYLGKTMSHLWDGDEHDREDEPCDPSLQCRYVMAWTWAIVVPDYSHLGDHPE